MKRRILPSILIVSLMLASALLQASHVTIVGRASSNHTVNLTSPSLATQRWATSNYSAAFVPQSYYVTNQTGQILDDLYNGSFTHMYLDTDGNFKGNLAAGYWWQFWDDNGGGPYGSGYFSMANIVGLDINIKLDELAGNSPFPGSLRMAIVVAVDSSWEAQHGGPNPVYTELDFFDSESVYLHYLVSGGEDITTDCITYYNAISPISTNTWTSYSADFLPYIDKTLYTLTGSHVSPQDSIAETYIVIESLNTNTESQLYFQDFTTTAVYSDHHYVMIAPSSDPSYYTTQRWDVARYKGWNALPLDYDVNSLTGNYTGGLTDMHQKDNGQFYGNMAAGYWWEYWDNPPQFSGVTQHGNAYLLTNIQQLPTTLNLNVSEASSTGDNARINIQVAVARPSGIYYIGLDFWDTAHYHSIFQQNGGVDVEQSANAVNFKFDSWENKQLNQWIPYSFDFLPYINTGLFDLTGSCISSSDYLLAVYVAIPTAQSTTMFEVSFKNFAMSAVYNSFSVTLPSSQVIPENNPVTLTPTISGGSSPFSYQWYVDCPPPFNVGAPVSNSPTYTLDYGSPVTYLVYVTITANGLQSTSNWCAVTFYEKHGGGCVLAGTSILMADGKTLPAQAVKPGDEIKGYNVQTGKFVLETVTSNNCTDVGSILSINNGMLFLTPTDQPIYTDHGWIRNPQDVEIGWKIYCPTKNAWITVNSLKTLNGHFRVYDVVATQPDTFIGNGLLLDMKPIPV